MEIISIPADYVAIRQSDNQNLVIDSTDLYRLKKAALSGIYWKRYSYNNSLEIEYDPKPIMDALRFLFPSDYVVTVEKAKTALLAAEAKGEEE